MAGPPMDLPPTVPAFVLEKWTARRDMGPRIDRAAAKQRGWERDPLWVGRPGKGLVPFQKDDPRVAPADCTHTQIKDLDGPGPVSRCMDCGGLIHTAARVLLEDPALLDDESLDTLRQKWNDAHWAPPTF